MKKVILIGDSIRMGYQETVRQALAGLAEVIYPAENGETSRNVLAHLDEWVLRQAPDVVHLNCGLHDLKREFDSGSVAVPVDEYQANVRRILEEIKGRTGAAVIWATTTPVNQARHRAAKTFDRFEPDVDRYNTAAGQAAAGLAVPVNDLAALVLATGRDRLLDEDGVHFTEEGYTLLGRAVAEKIRPYLASGPGALEP